MKILMCPPSYYGIFYEINPWMHKSTAVNKKLAQTQWQSLYLTIQRCGAEINLIDPATTWPDMVFTANAALVYKNTAFLSHFKYPERQGEYSYFKASHR